MEESGAASVLWSAVVDNNRPLHIARRSSIINPTIDNRFSKIDSMIDFRRSIRLSTFEDRFDYPESIR